MAETVDAHCGLPHASRHLEFGVGGRYQFAASHPDTEIFKRHEL
jgi:hypothetical protein